jgi:hypothetical protein
MWVWTILDFAEWKGRAMRDEIVIEHEGDYVHVRQYGRDSYEISLDLWRRVVAACEEHQCFNVLGENFSTDSFSMMDAYDHGKIFQIAGVTLRHRIAWVHHDPGTIEPTRFAETVLKNRGLANGYLFTNVEDAKRWLLGEGGE